MASVFIPLGQDAQLARRSPGDLLVARVTDHGSRSHPYPHSEALLAGPTAARNLADAVHYLSALHGRHPGLIEQVAARSLEAGARGWLETAGEAFGRERALLARLAVEVGPLPATPGRGNEAALATQRTALATLAHSERRGVALGAALAFAVDWAAIRGVLDAAARRFAVALAPPWRGDPCAVEEVVAAASADLAVGRALMFGAEQVALQHRALWDLMQARAEARER